MSQSIAFGRSNTLEHIFSSIHNCFIANTDQNHVHITPIDSHLNLHLEPQSLGLEAPHKDSSPDKIIYRSGKDLRDCYNHQRYFIITQVNKGILMVTQDSFVLIINTPRLHITIPIFPFFEFNFRLYTTPWHLHYHHSAPLYKQCRLFGQK